ncbi:hypothetical protein F2P56_007242 [Juglans regia]|uniref:Berberine/berberine-like domain-containing protein n=2 Tax=Juglans regia TaxID=51240 RepID=A0A833Y2X8_JUGRE|nr:berberine bridge enzyme-like 23 [Juglans regia]KAF5475437.1 hypothetical protein F2P56_007242 [Juglans regia]
MRKYFSGALAAPGARGVTRSILSLAHVKSGLHSLIFRSYLLSDEHPLWTAQAWAWSSTNSSQEGRRTIQASFSSLYLGGIDNLLSLMQESFPELGLTPLIRPFFKAKSDYVMESIAEVGFDGIWERFYEKEAETTLLIFTPYGQKMSEISESAIPFPHRAGNIYKIQYLVYWEDEGIAASEQHISWIRRLYSYMAAYVSKSPRAAYMNYRDLDIGKNNNKAKTSYRRESIWGAKYFKKNFNRLVHVKIMIDPTKFFRTKQSIPAFSSW